jgi:hypothetical protein
MAERTKRPRRRLRLAEWLIPVYVLFFLLFLGMNLGNSYSYAWLFGSSTADNTFVTPEMDIFVDESNDGINYGTWTPQDIAWGSTVDKYARFTNTGEGAVVIRAAYAQQWSVTSGTDVVQLNNLYANGFVFEEVAQPDWVDGGFLNTTLWYDGGDGWYYYRLPLAPGQSTQTILESVTFVSPAPEGYAAADYALAFKVEATQYSSNPDNENQQAVWLAFAKTYTESGGTLTWSTSAP